MDPRSLLARLVPPDADAGQAVPPAAAAAPPAVAPPVETGQTIHNKGYATHLDTPIKAQPSAAPPAAAPENPPPGATPQPAAPAPAAAQPPAQPAATFSPAPTPPAPGLRVPSDRGEAEPLSIPPPDARIMARLSRTERLGVMKAEKEATERERRRGALKRAIGVVVEREVEVEGEDKEGAALEAVVRSGKRLSGEELARVARRRGIDVGTILDWIKGHASPEADEVGTPAAVRLDAAKTLLGILGKPEVKAMVEAPLFNLTLVMPGREAAGVAVGVRNEAVESKGKGE